MDQPKHAYTDLWARKMHKIFRGLDRKHLGYITEEYLWDLFKGFIEAHPEVDEAKMKEQHQHTWKVLYNHGQDVPKDHRLTEEAFVKNMWVTVNQPDFKKTVDKMSKEGLEQLDLQHQGYITKDEYVKFYARIAGEEQATAVFNAMDIGCKGKVGHDDYSRAKHFYYTDLSDESNPLTQMHGPLD